MLVVMQNRRWDSRLRLSPTWRTKVSENLIICTLCQRVQRGRDWVPTEQVIRELRSYELDFIPRLHGVVCDDCAESILRRRATSDDALAA